MRLKCGLHYPRYSSYNYSVHTASDLSHILISVTVLILFHWFLQLMLTYSGRFSRYATVTNFLLKPECRYICTSFIESVKMFSRATKEVKGSPYSPFG